MSKSREIYLEAHVSDAISALVRNGGATVTTAEFNALALRTGGKLASKGRVYSVKGKKIAPGVYNLYLSESED